MSLAGELLERAARAMPAAVEDRSSGWWLRHTDGDAWWSGAVLAHDATGGDLSERIVAAERFYAEHRATPRFQVCDGCPPGLDPLLAGRRYRWDSPISLRVTSCDEAVEPPQLPGFQVRVASEFDLAWLAVQSSAGTPEASAAQEARLLRRVQLPSAYVTVFAGPEPVAVGRAVADDGWTGVFSMATAPQARRRGAARLVLAVIASWARDQGAPRLYLQVERSNAPAARLYGATGFTEIATYHYRVGNRPALAGSRTGQRRE